MIKKLFIILFLVIFILSLKTAAEDIIHAVANDIPDDIFNIPPGAETAFIWCIVLCFEAEVFFNILYFAFDRDSDKKTPSKTIINKAALAVSAVLLFGCANLIGFFFAPLLILVYVCLRGIYLINAAVELFGKLKRN